ncbi:MAG: GNAT family N-acetyltransferase [Alphaproteobacteria bacterium]|nr:GNAT family N-acetyltransferase [Alphaproteobacteria bacterium]
MVQGTKSIKLTGYRPGGLGKTVELHGRYYGAEWGFDIGFESDVAAEMAGFLTRFDADRDGLWLAWLDDEMVGSITIDGEGADNRAHLRWFIADPEITGRGIGAQLMDAAMSFCRNRGYSGVWLTTFAGLDAARKLYDRHGFIETGTFENTDWDRPITMQTLECPLSP